MFKFICNLLLLLRLLLLLLLLWLLWLLHNLQILLEKADFYGICERMMNIDWNAMMAVNFTADTLWAYFSHVLQCAVIDFVPITLCRNPSNNTVLLNIRPSYVQHSNVSSVCGNYAEKTQTML